MRRSFFLMVLFATACNENEFKRASNTEEFLQAPSNQVDILWVIDNSTSMINEQEAVALGAEDFIANLETTEMDFHLGVISTDVERTNPTAGVLLGNPQVLSAETPGYADAFRTRVQLGNDGTDQESGLEAAVMAITAPNSVAVNAGFIRDGAMLSVIILSDENDCSDYGALGSAATGEDCYTRPDELTPVPDLVRDLVDAKGSDKVVLSGIIGPEIVDGCEATVPGRRYVNAVELLGGVRADICTTDYSLIMDSLGQVASGILTVFQLEKAAIEESIEVRVTPLEGEERVVPEYDEAAGVLDGWSYLADYAQIEFKGTEIPPRGAAIVVEYDVAGNVAEVEATDSGTP